MVAIMTLCVSGIRAGRNTVGDFVMLNAMLIQLYQPLNFMGMLYREVRQAVIDIAMMFEILRQPNEIAEAPEAPELVVNGGALRFENVHFAYDPAREILRGVDFEVPAGHTLAIVGPSGAGKSTISRLIFRFFEPQQGRITIDGQDISTVSLASLRRNLGMAPQDNVLFNDSIRYNILYGRPDATEEEMRAAAELARIAHFIESAPGGFDAQVGERGLKLSGGEKQRVAIARTLLKAPPILVLDEATSALDTLTEREIQAALEAASRGRTTIVIAHRLSTVVNADEILVLDKGEVAERGDHATLLAQERGLCQPVAAPAGRTGGSRLAQGRGAALRRPRAGRLARTRRRDPAGFGGLGRRGPLPPLLLGLAARIVVPGPLVLQLAVLPVGVGRRRGAVLLELMQPLLVVVAKVLVEGGDETHRVRGAFARQRRKARGLGRREIAGRDRARAGEQEDDQRAGQGQASPMGAPAGVHPDSHLILGFAGAGAVGAQPRPLPPPLEQAAVFLGGFPGPARGGVFLQPRLERLVVIRMITGHLFQPWVARGRYYGRLAAINPRRKSPLNDRVALSL